MTKSVTMTSDVNSEAEQQPPFATLIGMNIIHVSKDKIVAELPVREELNNRFGALHGGAVMALADTLGGTAIIANLPKGGHTRLSRARRVSSPAFPLGTSPAPSARRSIVAAPRWCGRRASRAVTIDCAPW